MNIKMINLSLIGVFSCMLSFSIQANNESSDINKMNLKQESNMTSKGTRKERKMISGVNYEDPYTINYPSSPGPKSTKNSNGSRGYRSTSYKTQSSDATEARFNSSSRGQR